MFVSVFALLTLATVAMSAPAPESDLLVGPVDTQQLFAEWKGKHSKTYLTEEENSKRFKIFEESVNKIIEHNKKYEAGEVTWTQGLNQFADLTQEEFSKTYLGAKKPAAGLAGVQ